ncbi:hypothetical protein CW751_14545 [Brumimicrobium salinarum]|uniref:Outer membrane protein beta-barrel domain-containing protein n=2 Tax=Brumimicrobium salinarum TaxID=2058658 RepID=A0A2I0QZ12_9FLAO|nr:hypothetical protein CW751_14545 [Brumimicrobium salinarum]
MVFSASQSLAQSNKISIQGGATITQFNSSVISNQELKFGDIYYLGFERETTSNLLLSIGLSYTSMGSNLIGEAFDSLSVTQFTSTFDFNYISIPLRIGKKIGDNFFGFGYLGVSNRLLLSATEDRPIINSKLEITGRQEAKITKDIKRFDFAGLADLGFGKKFSNHEVFLSYSFTFSATSFSTDSFFSGSKPRNFGSFLKIGYNYCF